MRLVITLGATIILLCTLHIESKENCYYVGFLNSSWTDNRPRFEVNMTFSNETGIASTTIINEDIAMPVSRLSVIIQGNKEKPKTVYNVTTKLCDMQAIFNSVPLFKPARDNVLKQSNYTFSCPLSSGVYVMQNMRINPRNPLLGLMYHPKRSFIVHGGLYEELAGGTLRPLSLYFMHGKVVKKTCGGGD